MESPRQLFLQEARELLTSLEETLLELEADPNEPELVDLAMRILHNLKGSGAMFGFEDLAAFAHEFESVFAQARDGKLMLTKPLIDVALRGRDHLQALLEGRASAADGAPIVHDLHGLELEESPAPIADNEPESTAYRIHFEPVIDLLAKGTNPSFVFAELARMGTLDIRANLDQVPRLDSLVPEECHVSWDMTLTTTADVEDIRRIFMLVDMGAKLSIEPVAADEVPFDEDDGEDDEESIAPWGPSSAKASTSIRVPANKLDKLVDLVGELVIAQARLSRVASELHHLELSGIAEQIEGLTMELRDSTLDVRMLTIGTTFSSFRRLVRDLASDLDKEVDLVTSGESTELDKTVIERIFEPLVHLIRNAIDHGIELPEVRSGNNKPRRATVRLTAEHADAYVVIKVSDDGRGFDVERIRARAIELNLIARDQPMLVRDLLQLAFSPGFTTSESVSAVSGRGVGLDVVKRAIEGLRGTLELDSQPGEGSVFTIRLPLTLAIIEGLLIKAGPKSYVMPLSFVEECVELHSSLGPDGRVRIRGERVPFVRLREWFGIGGASERAEQLVVVNLDGSKFGFVVDRIVGQNQTVIKSLNEICSGVRGFSGATILGDGTVALILDPSEIAAVAAAA